MLRTCPRRALGWEIPSMDGGVLTPDTLVNNLLQYSQKQTTRIVVCRRGVWYWAENSTAFTFGVEEHDTKGVLSVCSWHCSAINVLLFSGT